MRRIAGNALAAAMVLSAAVAAAQPADELTAARQLFAEAMNDERDGRFADALAKYRRVDAVRDTANVRFRMGACLEGQGRLAAATAEFRASQRLSEGQQDAAPVQREARERAERLERRLAHLTLELPRPAPGDLVVRVDGVETSASGSLPVDPGAHTVTVEGGGAAFRTSITLPEGGEATLPVILGAASDAPDPRTSPARVQVGDAPGTLLPTWVALGGAGLLAAGAVTAVLVRQSSLDALDAACSPSAGGALVCPESARASATADRDRALVAGPLAVGLGAAALAAGGFALTWALTRSPGSAGAVLAPVPGGAGVWLAAAWR